MRFGVLCNGTEFQKWQVLAMEELIGEGHKLELLIKDARVEQKSHPPSKFHHFFRRNLFFRIYQRWICIPSAKKIMDFSKSLEGIDMLTCSVEKVGYKEYFNKEEVRAIETYKLDFILRFGFNILHGEILNAAKFGVWSFHHDDEINYRGGPPGFWEIYQKAPVNGAILQRLTEKLDAGIILKKGYMKTILHSYSGNLDQLLYLTASWPAQVAREILRFPDEFEKMSVTTAPLYRIPDNFQMILFFLKLLKNRIKFYYRDLLAAEVWNVGLIKKPIHEVALGVEQIENKEITWLRQFAKTKYLADPFGFFENKKLHILVENYSYSKQQAHISEIIWDSSRDSFSVPITIIEEEKHLSYPFIVKDQEILYCIPESYRTKNIKLYRRNFSEEAFIEDRILLTGVDAIDPALFFYEQRWWLFFTEKKYSNALLFIYYADSINGHFQPHARNPVKTDVRSARPGGTPFLYEDQLYRPAQDCSITYGGRVVVNKVTRLTTEHFEEHPVKILEPIKNSPFPKGLHTLSQVGPYTLIDGKKYRINRYFFLSQMKEKLKKRNRPDV
ncbi:MAG: hypothetical protein PHF97_03195 [Bacteroidales bacterium]|nr:hypothetical protein [Bacteroidales bacterium]MDD4602800.1 hypothetical protein [Bacteroidales bacterium]